MLLSLELCFFERNLLVVALFEITIYKNSYTTNRFVSLVGFEKNFTINLKAEEFFSGTIALHC